MKRVSVLLITLALILSLAGCPAAPVPEPPVQYSLRISSTVGGSVTTPGEGEFAYEEGAVVNLRASPVSGYSFSGWTGDVSTIADVRAASTRITVNGDYSITASFQVIPAARYSLTVSSTEGGSVAAPGEGTFTYDAGTVVDLVAEAEERYQFTYWTGSVATIGDVNAASTSVTMTGDYTITASFAKEIRTWYDLDAIRDNRGGSYLLMNDLDSTSSGYEELAGRNANQGKGWQPIGGALAGGLIGAPFVLWVVDPVEPFAGSFDGQRYEIADLFINIPDEDGVGLFGSVGEVGFVKNVGVVNADITGHGAVGGLVGLNLGAVNDSYSSGSIAGDYWYVGGMVGVNRGTLTNSYCTGSISGGSFLGGLVGMNHLGTIDNSFSTGSVTGDVHVAGLVGDSILATVSNSYSTGSVTGNGEVGGLIAESIWDTVSNSYYNYDDVLINGENIITIGALFAEDFEQWLAHDKFLDINDRLSQQDGYYVINDVADFKQLLAFGQDESLKFRLKADIDVHNEEDLYIPYFAGEFDGNGHSITNLSFGFDFVSQVGLFGILARRGVVTGVGVENVKMTGSWHVGALVGWNHGTVSNSYSTGEVTGYGTVGGLVGKTDGTLSSSYSTASVDGDRHVGGLVGSNADGTVGNSNSSGRVTGKRVIGGLVGYNQGTASTSYSTGSVIGSAYVGGMVGVNVGSVHDSYSTGSVTRSSGEDTDVGGFVGANYRGKIINCYSTGSVGYEGVADPADKGFAGSAYTDGDYEMKGNFWDTKTSGQTSTAGDATGKTTTEMKSIATFTNTATEGLEEPWHMIGVGPGEIDQTYTWNIVDGQTYPFLSWQPVS